MTVLSHLAEQVAELLRDDSRRVLLGEDVTDGGMLGLSREAVADERLREQVIATPLLPTVMAAHAAGLAASGRHPIVLLPDAGALVEGLAGLREATAWSWRNEGAVEVPLLFVAPCGPGLGLGGHATEAPEAMLVRVPGLHVLCAGSAEEAGAWLRAAVEHAASEGPTVLLLPRSLLLRAPQGPMAHDLGRSPSAAHRVRDARGDRGDAGSAPVTVLSWGEALPVALEAVDHAGVDAAVVDLGCLAPLDLPTVEAELRLTGRAVIVHAGPRAGGVGAELAAHLADASILVLDAPVVRVTGAGGPLRPADEGDALPTVAQVAEALARVAGY
ncbi:MAG: hypothetical protein KC501_39795 [Myxococcales bacterium]|nr:hypothetical protein [Myxococcales bacterium]